MKKGYLLLVILLLCAVTAFAVDPAGADVTDVAQYGPINGTNASNTTVTAGYIRTVTLVNNMSTTRWSGIMGNVSGNIQLGSGSSDVMFTWTGEGLLIYAAENIPDWSALGSSTGAALDGAYGYLGVATSDTGTNTFAGGEDIGSNIFSISSEFTSTSSNGGTDWKTYVLYDGTSEYVFAGKVDAGNENYRGDTVDFQMIVPEDGPTAGATTYGLWVELV